MSELQTACDRDPYLEGVLRSDRGPFLHLLDTAQVKPFRAGGRTEYSCPLQRLTLADLLNIAGRYVDDSVTGTPGSTAKDESWALERINGKLQTRITTLCNNVARHLARPGEPVRSDDDLEQIMRRVGPEYFAWDPSAGPHGAGDWRIFTELAARASTKKGQTQAIGTARKLLNLMATHHWIPRAARHAEDYQVIPAGWSDLYNEWHVAVVGDISHAKFGLLELLKACERLEIDPETADDQDWAEVTEHLDEHFRGTGWSSPDRSRVRGAYRALLRADLIEGPKWNGRRLRRGSGTTLVPGSCIRGVAELYGSEGDREGVGRALEGQDVSWPGFAAFEEGLLAGDYGMKRWMLYQTASAVDAPDLGLPLRAVYPRRPIRASSPRADVAWRKGTIEIALQRLLYFAGWLAENQGVDWSASDLRALVDWKHVTAYRHAVFAGRATTESSFLRLVGQLARIASPYLEAIALKNGDEPLADSMAEVSARLASNTAVNGQPSLKTRLDREGSENDIETMRRVANLVERAWTRDGAVADFAHDQFEKVAHTLVDRLQEDYGSLRDQMAKIREGATLGTSWARDVLDALYWHDQLVVPLRVSTSRRLDLSERLHTPDFERIHARIPGSKIKPGDGPVFLPNYTTAGGRAYPRDLYELYVMPRGARQVLRTPKDGDPRDVDAFYAPDIEACKNTTTRISGRSFCGIVRRGVKKAEGVTGVSKQELKQAGVPCTHQFRHGFATRMVRAGLIEVAALYLHHRDTKMLREVYSAINASHYDAGELLRRARADVL